MTPIFDSLAAQFAIAPDTTFSFWPNEMHREVFAGGFTRTAGFTSVSLGWRG